MEKIPEKILEQLREFSVPELCDGMGIYNIMDNDIKPMVTQQKIIGPALTVKVPIGEGAIVTKALEMVKPGEVIVIAGHGNCKSSYWGDHRSFCAKFQKAQGVVIDGAFRDIEGCEEIGFPIYAKGITPGTAGKSGVGEINVSVSCGGAIVNPGDIVVGDRNGVCVIPLEKVEEVMEKARRKIKAQKWTLEEMKRTRVVMPRVIFDKNK
ncbi:RraA family protein [Irregularibacter muris]|uniref:Putative 4-hydroxy-4-methyl-2-oxoglutarate aldolase n=1 Tax=Irregularibacter muris TaxID=1796619 RepID=A0AAE3L2R8_9FIRM|nr:RraA family protein [Irregularibacter muris]MCR1899129.1 RraA family protein [Irregularibacter muris]